MNIQPNDLRTGNILQYFIGEDGCDWDDTKIDWQDLKWCDEENENFNKVHKGMPLTETLLCANNFTFDGVNLGHWWMNLQTHGLELISSSDGWYPVFIQFPELSSENEQRVGLKKVLHVHELQNLIYALTGQEWNVQTK